MISVIVPIYNVEKYLVQCIESILSQSYKDIELILVDDGSPDNSPQICDEYKKKDSRIKVVHKQNAGLGYARNTGLEHATGDFVCFVDSDDYLKAGAFETWMNYQSKYDADLVMASFEKANDLNEQLFTIRSTEKTAVYSTPIEVEKNLFWPMIGQESKVLEDCTVNMCVWLNLYRREIIEANNIRFLSERDVLSEDICFNLQYLLCTQCAVVIPDILYSYRYNPTSLTGTYKGDEFFKACKLYDHVKKWSEKAKNQQYKECRLERFMLTKTRELLFRLGGCKYSFSKKIEICKEIIRHPLMQQVLDGYPIQNYKLKYKIPAYLLKNKNAALVIAFFYLTDRIKKRKLAG